MNDHSCPCNLKPPPNDVVEVTKAHLDEGWSWASAHRKFYVSSAIWYRWLKICPDLAALNPHAKKRVTRALSKDLDDWNQEDS